ncbi:TVP38/TMEM64 family protein [Enemella sp. A6]|uniref:TVP38/TMEM64 family protein n=1 Tax=Enemella sp. A6 TaxID=3440152 RepID=UPI003EBFA394
MSAHDSDTPEQDDSGISWSSLLRTLGLVAVIVVMVWLAFNVRLPPLKELRADIEYFGWWGWLVFIGSYALVALTPIPVTLMALAAGVLFGTIGGTVLSLIGSMLGGIGAYWIARALGKQTVLRLLGSRAATLEKRLDSAGFEAVFTLRVMPGMPYWPINYGAGALGVPFGEFATASGIASLPGQASLVSIGSFAAQPNLWSGLVVVISWAVVLVLTIWSWRVLKGSSHRSLPGAPKGH